LITVPDFFSMWAVTNGREPATRFSVSTEDVEAYFGRARSLVAKGKGDSAESVWNSMPAYDRNIMVTAFLLRPATRKLLVHITPTLEEAVHTISTEGCFEPVEKLTAIEYLPSLVDKNRKLLFGMYVIM
jgi:hypothetical protein